MSNTTNIHESKKPRTRFIIMDEKESDDKISPGTIKKLTGGDKTDEEEQVKKQFYEILKSAFQNVDEGEKTLEERSVMFTFTAGDERDK